jgi:hypothetical protein
MNFRSQLVQPTVGQQECVRSNGLSTVGSSNKSLPAVDRPMRHRKLRRHFREDSWTQGHSAATVSILAEFFQLRNRFHAQV